jgi:hypothetical protein
MSRSTLIITAVCIAAAAIAFSGQSDMLNGFNEKGGAINEFSMQVAISSFCVFQSGSVHSELSATHDTFHDDGEQDESTYKKQSIYAILYSLYELMGIQDFEGQQYQFTFNTWGISPNKDMRLGRWDEKDPQRHGRAACTSLLRI